MNELLKYNQQYIKKGYFVYKKFIKKNFILKLIKEINSAKNSVRYYDVANKLRRIEKIYNKGKNLNILNKKLSKLLKQILETDFLIFKDKFNAKPPGGEGFFAHYDGIFQFIDKKNIIRNGWYEYSDKFVNVLVALDKCNSKNGTLELSKNHEGSFEDLLQNTKKNGTPELKKKIEKEISFKKVILDIGDIVVFSNLCPHRSKKNNSTLDRRTLYYTYTEKKYGNLYKKYFKDKKSSKNQSKALSITKKIKK